MPEQSSLDLVAQVDRLVNGTFPTDLGRANDFNGFDYPAAAGVVVRMFLDDNQINVLLMRDGGPVGPRSTFTDMPALIVANVIRALLLT